ncbi:hypothetical protein SAMN04489806_1673 [Paramicrobacterium humi]|uniref:Uncharacterized protein n=1 Tax=Paramicrobacterium humi TaxID=640635 RepID=A0A1H4LWY3_9MICO|nr:hypothetical protein [Microbacterium humi]SEB74785.1 hypothetical protein SAMN04489806_1673 [Microbacterium humi]
MRTLSGACYELDLDQSTMTRTKEVTGEPRFEGDAISLVEVIDCRVDKPLRLVVQLALPGTVRVKWTATPVVSIDEIAET